MQLLGGRQSVAHGRAAGSRRSVPQAPALPRSLGQPGAADALLGRSAGLRTAPGLKARRSARGAVRVEAFFNKLFKTDPSAGTRNKYQSRVDQVNALEPAMQALSDDQLRAKTTEFKERVKKGESLESILPEAFAVRRRELAGVGPVGVSLNVGWHVPRGGHARGYVRLWRPAPPLGETQARQDHAASGV